MKSDNECYPFYANLQIVNNYKDFFEQIRADWKCEAKGNDYSPRQFYDLASDFAKKQEKRTVFLIDEVDDLLWYDVNQILFGTFRALSQNEKCRFVFSGERVLNRQTHDSHSPLFNFCINIHLSYLDYVSLSSQLLLGLFSKSKGTPTLFNVGMVPPRGKIMFSCKSFHL